MWDNYAEWYRRGPGASFLVEARLPAGAPVQLFRVRRPAGHYSDPGTADMTVHFVLKGSRAHLDFGSGHFLHNGRSGDFALGPAGVACAALMADLHEVLVLSVPGALLRGVLAEATKIDLRDHGPLHAAMNRDTVIESLLCRLWAEAAEGNPMGPLFADDAAAAVAGRLARLALRASGMPDMDEDTPPLHGARLARVLALIEDSLDAELRQAVLAAVAGLSPWHFARAFRAATGVAPHRFVLLRRLARAQWLLRATKLDVAEVAAACGFADHAHLTVTFKRQTGTTPSQWRAALRD